jgi:hypothetical protein
MTQLDSKTLSALRTILDDVCSHLPLSAISARTLVASRILDRAQTGHQTFDELKQVGLEALRTAPTLWR